MRWDGGGMVIGSSVDGWVCRIDIVSIEVKSFSYTDTCIPVVYSILLPRYSPLMPLSVPYSTSWLALEMSSK